MTPTNHPSWPIAAPLRQRINRAAHEQGHTHELTLRADWLAKVQTARDAGATFAELNQMLDVMVTGGTGGEKVKSEGVAEIAPYRTDRK